MCSGSKGPAHPFPHFTCMGATQGSLVAAGLREVGTAGRPCKRDVRVATQGGSPGMPEPLGDFPGRKPGFLSEPPKIFNSDLFTLQCSQTEAYV